MMLSEEQLLGHYGPENLKPILNPTENSEMSENSRIPIPYVSPAETSGIPICYEIGVKQTFGDQPYLEPLTMLKSAAACQVHCMYNEDCTYWEWNLLTTKCYLRYYKGTNVTDNPMYWSGPKTCETSELGKF